MNRDNKAVVTLVNIIAAICVVFSVAIIVSNVATMVTGTDYTYLHILNDFRVMGYVLFFLLLFILSNSLFGKVLYGIGTFVAIIRFCIWLFPDYYIFILSIILLIVSLITYYTEKNLWGKASLMLALNFLTGFDNLIMEPGEAGFLVFHSFLQVPILLFFLLLLVGKRKKVSPASKDLHDQSL